MLFKTLFMISKKNKIVYDVSNSYSNVHMYVFVYMNYDEHFIHRKKELFLINFVLNKYNFSIIENTKYYIFNAFFIISMVIK